MARRRTLLRVTGAALAAIAGCQGLGATTETDTSAPTAGTTARSEPNPDELSSSWATGADLPKRRTQTTAVALDGSVYVIGGIVDGGDRHTAVYVPDEDRWRTVAPPPKPINHTSAVTYDGRIHAFGGYSGSFLGTDPLDAHWIYDPAEESWTATESMPTARAGIAGAVLAGYLFVFGGEEVGEQVFEAVEAYHPPTDTWTTVEPLPTPRWGLGVATLDGAIYTVGGGAVPSGEETRALEIMTVE